MMQSKLVPCPLQFPNFTKTKICKAKPHALGKFFSIVETWNVSLRGVMVLLSVLSRIYMIGLTLRREGAEIL
jgi:hypothetical protein